MKKESLTITIARQHSGLLLDTVYNNRYIKKLYIGYNQREARQDFRQYVKEQK